MTTPGKRRAESPDIDLALMSMTTTSSPPLSSSSLRSSMSASDQSSLVVHTPQEWRNLHLPLNQRWLSSVIEYPFGSKMDEFAAGNVASETLLQMQRNGLVSNQMFVGLDALKSWVTTNVYRKLVPPLDETLRSVLRVTQTDPFCVTASAEGCGVRSYLQSVCKELRIDLFVVSPLCFVPEMPEGLLNEVRSRGRRAMILFDRPDWFTTATYPTRGAVFVHHLDSILGQLRQVAVMNQQMDTIVNEMRIVGMDALLPSTWIVVSSSLEDIHPDVTKYTNGCFIRVGSASYDLAVAMVRNQLLHQLKLCQFLPDAIENTLSQTNYRNTVTKIAQLLSNSEVGQIIGIMQWACKLVVERNYEHLQTQRNIELLLPYQPDVQHAMDQLSGRSAGGALGARATAAAHGNSEAALMAQQINNAATTTTTYQFAM
jgi:hypothetical protein